MQCRQQATGKTSCLTFLASILFTWTKCFILIHFVLLLCYALWYSDKVAWCVIYCKWHTLLIALRWIIFKSRHIHVWTLNALGQSMRDGGWMRAGMHTISLLLYYCHGCIHLLVLKGLFYLLFQLICCCYNYFLTMEVLMIHFSMTKAYIKNIHSNSWIL